MPTYSRVVCGQQNRGAVTANTAHKASNSHSLALWRKKQPDPCPRFSLGTFYNVVDELPCHSTHCVPGPTRSAYARTSLHPPGSLLDHSVRIRTCRPSSHLRKQNQTKPSPGPSSSISHCPLFCISSQSNCPTAWPTPISLPSSSQAYSNTETALVRVPGDAQFAEPSGPCLVLPAAAGTCHPSPSLLPHFPQGICQNVALHVSSAASPAAPSQSLLLIPLFHHQRVQGSVLDFLLFSFHPFP